MKKVQPLLLAKMPNKYVPTRRSTSCRQPNASVIYREFCPSGAAASPAIALLALGPLAEFSELFRFR